MQREYKSRVHKGKGRAIINRADAEATRTGKKWASVEYRERVQREYKPGVRSGSRRAIIKRADAAAIQIKGPQRKEKG